MKRFLSGLSMAFSMFTVFPLPCRWDDGARRMQLACLPVVGLFIGVVWAAACYGCFSLRLPALLSGALLAALPHIMSGCIHLDGLMDTADAVFSWRTLEERLQIMKDSHAGSFAIITLTVTALFSFASAASLDKSVMTLVTLAAIPVVSRIAAAVAMMYIRPLGHSAYAKMERQKNTPYLIALIITLAAACTAVIAFSGAAAIVPIAAEIFGMACALAFACSSLKGMSGDIAGWTMTIGETCALTALCILRSII